MAVAVAIAQAMGRGRSRGRRRLKLNAARGEPRPVENLSRRRKTDRRERVRDVESGEDMHG